MLSSIGPTDQPPHGLWLIKLPGPSRPSDSAVFEHVRSLEDQSLLYSVMRMVQFHHRRTSPPAAGFFYILSSRTYFPSYLFVCTIHFDWYADAATHPVPCWSFQRYPPRLDTPSSCMWPSSDAIQLPSLTLCSTDVFGVPSIEPKSATG